MATRPDGQPCGSARAMELSTLVTGAPALDRSEERLHLVPARPVPAP
jgi:hypothetical protein